MATLQDLIDSRLARHMELGEQLSQPEAMADMKSYQLLTREYARLEELRLAVARLKELEQRREEAEALLEDPDLGEMAKEELEAVEGELPAARQAMTLLALPAEPDEDRDVYLEIRAGAGGEEAALFGAELMRMYFALAAKHGWTAEAVSLSETDLGGAKEAVIAVSGPGVYGWLRYENGAHRVQRVPVTESGGRIHTSAVTVAVMTQAEEQDLEIRQEDLKIDTYRSGGAGGQHVNKTDSAVRITHIPTGVVVACQDQRSQIQNRERAMQLLRSRLLDDMREKREAAEAADRKAKVGSGDRSGRIRTYNFPQGRVTDHRVGVTLYKLEEFMAGDMDEILDALRLARQEERLKESLA